jgi:tRNA nucleotidyltransferase (CCA-adding enzyme)
MLNNNLTLKIIIPPFVRSIISRLRDNRYQAYPVGGAIRDSIMGRTATDWDITTDAGPSDIKKVFHDVKQFSLKHETVSLIESDDLYEITTMKNLNGNRKTIEKDLSYRDFTIDAIAYDVIKGSIIDPFGGMEDIREKRIRGVLNPVDRFSEDPLRLLRAVRLWAEMDFSMEEKTADAIFKMAHRLESVSKERIREELVKLLVVRKPSRGLNYLRKTGLMKYIIPELLEGVGKRQNHHHKYTIFRHVMETIDRIPPDPILRIAALLHDVAKPRVRKKIEGEFRFFGHAEASALLAKDIMKNLRFSNEDIKRSVNLIGLHMIHYDEKWSDGAVRRLIRRAGHENIQDLIILRKADIKGHGIKDDKISLVNMLEKRIREIQAGTLIKGITDLAVDGKKVMEVFDMESGPLVGEVLGKLLEKITETPELNNEKDLVNLMNEMKKNHSPSEG